MECIGHRGCAGQYPENTIEAVRRASRHLRWVEVDVRRCGSGELVVFHDETVDRVTRTSGAVADLPWEELSRLEVLGSGQTVPRLGSILDALPAGTGAQLELKVTGAAADVRDLVAGRDLDVAVSSFLPEALAEARSLDWAVPTGYLFEEGPEDAVRTAVELDCDAVHPHYDLCLGTDVVDAAREAGLDVVAWKAARTTAELEALREAGVDGVTVDRWDIVPEADDATAGAATDEPAGETSAVDAGRDATSPG